MADFAVLHICNPEPIVAYVKKLYSDTGVNRIGIAIENLFDRPIDELIIAHDKLKEEGYSVGICLDTGHCNVNKFYKEDVAETILKLGFRIKMLHVHDKK